MNDSTSHAPIDRARHIADQIGANPTPDVYRYVILKCAAEDVVANPSEIRLAELASVLAGIDLHGAQQLDALRATVAAIEAARVGEAR